jgi:hypothetical protein
MISALAAKIGEFVAMEPTSGDFAGNFFRVRVWLDVSKPLKNHVSLIKEKKRQIYLVKYERLPDWCALCGMIGHLSTEHGDGVHSPELLVFEGLRAGWSVRPTGGGRGRGGFGSSRGRGSAGRFFDRRGASSQVNTLVEEDDMDTDLNSDGKTLALTGTQVVGNLVNQFQSVGGVPPSPPMVRDPKRQRATDADKVQTGDITKLAGSKLEHRLEQ